MKVFFLCWVFSLLTAWIVISIKYGKCVGKNILQIIKKFLGGDKK